MGSLENYSWGSDMDAAISSGKISQPTVSNGKLVINVVSGRYNADTSYTVTYDDGNGCTDTATFYIKKDCGGGGGDDCDLDITIKNGGSEIPQTGGEITFEHSKIPVTCEAYSAEQFTYAEHRGVEIASLPNDLAGCQWNITTDMSSGNEWINSFTWDAYTLHLSANILANNNTSSRTANITLTAPQGCHECSTINFKVKQAGKGTPSDDIYQIAQNVVCDSSIVNENNNGNITVNINNNTSDQLLWNGRLIINVNGESYDFSYRDPSYEYSTTNTKRYRYCNLTNYILNCNNGGTISSRYSNNVKSKNFTYYLPIERTYEAYKNDNGGKESHTIDLNAIVNTSFNVTEGKLYMVYLKYDSNVGGYYLKSDAGIVDNCTFSYNASTKTLNVTISGSYSYKYNSNELKTFSDGAQALYHGGEYYPLNFSDFN